MTVAAAAEAEKAEDCIRRSSNKRDRQPEGPNADDSDEEAEFDDGSEPMQTDAKVDDADADAGGHRQVTPEKKAAAAAAEAKEAAAVAKGNETVFSPELLRTYYARLFPHELLTTWLSYDAAASTSTSNSDSGSDPSSSGGGGGGSGGSSTSLFARREWSFTIEPTPGDEIYIRYQSFVKPADLTAAIARRNPHKIDIGAVFTHPPKDHNALQGTGKFATEQRELVFDIDLTDYDGVRNCGCSGAKICTRCWRMMAMAVKVMERGLKEDFGFENVAWFYSGRRGVHAWVCDEKARTLSNEARSAVASYFEVSMGTEQNKTMNLPHPLHPTLARAYEILEPMFVQDILPASGHGLLATRASWEALLQTLPKGGEPVAARLGKKWDAAKFESTPEEKWNELKKNVSILIGKGGGGGSKAAKNLPTKDRIRLEQWPVETVFRHTYPRLDINVSKMQNHLLKSPFCVHPKTGRVCVPIDVDRVDDFDPFRVPTLPQLMRELDEYEKSSSEEEEEGGRKDEEGKSKKKKKLQYEWQKTSLRGPFEHFQKQFLTPLWNDLRRERRAEAEERAAVTGDF